MKQKTPSSHLQKRFDDPLHRATCSHQPSQEIEYPAGPLFWADETLALAAPQGMQVRGWEPLPTGRAICGTTWAGCGAQPLAISALCLSPLPGGACSSSGDLGLGQGLRGGGVRSQKERRKREIKLIQYPSLQM